MTEPLKQPWSMRAAEARENEVRSLGAAPHEVQLVFHPDAFQIVCDLDPEHPGWWRRFGRPGGFTEWERL